MLYGEQAAPSPHQPGPVSCNYLLLCMFIIFAACNMSPTPTPSSIWHGQLRLPLLPIISRATVYVACAHESTANGRHPTECPVCSCLGQHPSQREILPGDLGLLSLEVRTWIEQLLSKHAADGGLRCAHRTEHVYSKYSLTCIPCAKACRLEGGALTILHACCVCHRL